MQNSTLKFIFSLLAFYGILSSCLLANLIWKAMFLGNGDILLHVNRYGEGWLEVFITGVGIALLIGGTIYFLKCTTITQRRAKKEEYMILTKKEFEDLLLEKVKKKFNIKK